MRSFILFIFSVIIINNVYSQSDSLLIKDLDGDIVNDSVFYLSSPSQIVCKLSSQNFKPIKSYSNLSSVDIGGLKKTKSGFEFYVRHMRAGFANQFRYDIKSKRIQLIGMSRYEFGPANNDGSGQSSVNLLNNNYIGEWNYYDFKNDKLVKMPTTQTKMYIKKIYLEEYDGASQAEFENKCVELYRKSRKVFEEK